MRAQTGNAHLLLACLTVGVLGASAAPAQAQAYDFATCNPAVTMATACSATVTSCCYLDGTANNSLLRNSSGQGAIIIPMDRCHQASETGAGYTSPGTAAAPTWCHKSNDTVSAAGDGGMFTAYGLVYRLLQTQNLASADKINVYWVVNPSKDPPPGTGYIASDVDAWVLSATGAIPTSTGALNALGTDSAPVKIASLSMTSGVVVNNTYVYDRKELPLRGGFFMISAQDRDKFDQFLRGTGAYAATAMPFQSRTGCGGSASNSCRNWSAVDVFEVQDGAKLGWTNFGTGANQDLKIPLAVTLNYKPPRIAKASNVSSLWLDKANLNDGSPNLSGCASGGAMVPADAVYCVLTAANVSSNALVTGQFEWAWFDDNSTSCGPFWDRVRTFATQVPGSRAAGNVMLIDQPIRVVEECGTRQLLGIETPTNTWGLNASNATVNPSAPYIVRTPQNLFQQFGDIPLDFSSSSVQGWLRGVGGTDYKAAYYLPGTTLKRLVSLDAATVCTLQKATVGFGGNGVTDGACDNASEIQDVAAYARYQNDPNNGVIFYLPGNQVHNRSSQLRMVLNSLIATPTGTVPVTPSTTIEVSRSTPIATLLGEMVQGTYEVVSPTPPVTAFNIDAEAATFRFPYLKGHLRARDITSIPTTPIDANPYDDGDVRWDGGGTSSFPAVTPAGCTTADLSCRRVFTTTTATATPGTGIPLVTVGTASVGTLGSLMASGLTAANQSLLIQRILAGDDSSGSFQPRLGGIDRSTVAVIEPSPFVAPTTRPTIAYVGATDGMLHAFCANDVAPCQRGKELWAYIPRTNLSLLRTNLARVDGSPNVMDVFGDFYGTGRQWRTILIFSTGSGNASSNATKPASYALDISDPQNPKVLWEYAMEDVGVRAALEMGPSLEISQGRVLVGSQTKNLAFIHGANLGVPLAAGSVVAAIDVETGAQLWKTGYTFPNPPRGAGSAPPVPSSGVPGGAVPVDKDRQGLITDLVFATLYGDVWQLDPATGASRYQNAGVDAPMFRFSTNYQPFGATPAVYSDGNQLYAIVASGGFTDPSDTHWSCDLATITDCTTIHRVLRISLDPGGVAPVNETNTGDVASANLTAGQRAFASPAVIGDQLYVTVDTANVNSDAYGTTGAQTGRVIKVDLGGMAVGATTNVTSGAAGVTRGGANVFAGGSSLGAASTGTGTSVDTAVTAGVKRQLWLRTQ